MFGMMGMIEMIGSTWSVVGLTLGTLALVINGLKAKHTVANNPILQRRTLSFRVRTAENQRKIADRVRRLTETMEAHNIELVPIATNGPIVNEVVFSFDTT